MLKDGKNIARIVGIISIAMILGLLYGIAVSVSNIFSFDYINLKLYNLGLFDILSPDSL